MEDQNQYICSKCNRSFIKRKKDYDIHIQTCNGNKCIYCNKEFYNVYTLEKHIDICKSKIQYQDKTNSTNLENLNNKIIELENTIQSKDQTIANLEKQLRQTNNKLFDINYKYELVIESVKNKENIIQNLQEDINLKIIEIEKLKIAETYTNKQLEELKSQNNKYIEDIKTMNQNVVIYNGVTNNNQYANNIYNTALIKSPMSLLDEIDTKNILQTHNIKDEQQFVAHFHRLGITKHIQITDKARSITKYLDKNSQLIVDKNCSTLTNTIYSKTAQSALSVSKNKIEKYKEINEDTLNNQRDRNRLRKQVDKSSELAANIISKNKTSMNKFSKYLIKFADYNAKKIFEQHKNMKTFIGKLMNIFSNKTNEMFYHNFFHIGQQLRYCLKNEIVNINSEESFLVKNDDQQNIKIDGNFLLTFLLEIFNDKTKDIFIEEQLKNLLGNKYEHYLNVQIMSKFLFEKQSNESITKCKSDIMLGFNSGLD
jgi:hypothetical protein